MRKTKALVPGFSQDERREGTGRSNPSSGALYLLPLLGVEGIASDEAT